MTRPGSQLLSALCLLVWPESPLTKGSFLNSYPGLGLMVSQPCRRIVGSLVRHRPRAGEAQDGSVRP